MSLSKSLTAVAVLGAAASAASAAIIPSWRVNTINSAAIAGSGGLLTSSSISVSLLVELTNGSLFNVAGLDIDGALAAQGVAPGTVRYYQRGTVNNDIPDPDLFATTPALEFDTYVATADPTRFPGSPAATPGRLNGTGTSQIGNVALQPTSGQNRTGTFFNVAWGATPNNGENGVFEVARITFASGVVPGFTDLGAPGNPVAFGLVADSLSPNTNVALPPIPIAVPEPMSFAIAGLGLLALRRK